MTSIGIYEKFDQVVCATMVPHGKPMPDVYLYVCEQIGEKPEECIAIEDSDNGVLSAYRAGCNVVMVPDLAGPKPETAELLTGTFAHAFSPPSFSNALITFTIFSAEGHFSTQRPQPTQEYMPLLFAGKYTSLCIKR